MSTTNPAKASYATRIGYHSQRLSRLPDDKAALAFHHFLGALGCLCEPPSLINKGPTRKNLLLALERAVNSQSGT